MYSVDKGINYHQIIMKICVCEITLDLQKEEI